MRDLTTDVIQDLFEHLKPLLQKQNDTEGFETEDQPRHDVKPGEFMIMFAKPLEVGFKHRCTRNYVYMLKRDKSSNWFLMIPKTGKHFQLGKFDDYSVDRMPAALTTAKAITDAKNCPRRRRAERIEEYSGTFDGFSVISDADPGL